MQIKYIRDINRNFRVELLGTRQRIIVLPGVINRILGVDRNVSVGCREINSDQAAALGFIVNVAAKQEEAIA